MSTTYKSGGAFAAWLLALVLAASWSYAPASAQTTGTTPRPQQQATDAAREAAAAGRVAAASLRRGAECEVNGR